MILPPPDDERAEQTQEAFFRTMNLAEHHRRLVEHIWGLDPVRVGAQEYSNNVLGALKQFLNKESFPTPRPARAIDMPDPDAEAWRIRTGVALARFLKD